MSPSDDSKPMNIQPSGSTSIKLRGRTMLTDFPATAPWQFWPHKANVDVGFRSLKRRYR